jgi:DNA replication protein DnaC
MGEKRSMTQAKDVGKTIPEKLSGNKDKLINYILTSDGYLPLPKPIHLSDLVCQHCGSKEFYSVMMEDKSYAAFCGRTCEPSRLSKSLSATTTPPNSLRAILWPLFCEKNGIGNKNHDVKFEGIQQNKEKVDYLLKFATSPEGIIFMRGDPGTGKTYAAMAVCEYFTRRSISCIFTTQRQMLQKWTSSFDEKGSNYISSLSNASLLVVDDFGIGEPNAKFLEFFMDLINTRLQWKGKGTIITSNLTTQKFMFFCGEALGDRIITGQYFEFKGNSRRKTIAL